MTWEAFQSLAAGGGYTATPELFLEMPDEVLDNIWKTGYWDTVSADAIQAQVIADLLAW